MLINRQWLLSLRPQIHNATHPLLATDADSDLFNPQMFEYFNGELINYPLQFSIDGFRLGKPEDRPA